MPKGSGAEDFEATWEMSGFPAVSGGNRAPIGLWVLRALPRDGRLIDCSNTVVLGATALLQCLQPAAVGSA